MEPCLNSEEQFLHGALRASPLTQISREGDKWFKFKHVFLMYKMNRNLFGH
jgi:hypothetical protein